MRNIWKDGVFGVVTGDALGCPVQFKDREEIAKNPVTGMCGHGTFNLPAGSWTDDSSLTLALLDSICETGSLDLKQIMENFVAWLEEGKYTPYDYAYDIGTGTMRAIENYKLMKDPYLCGGRSEANNGNGSLMRILPACLYCCVKEREDEVSACLVDAVGSLTHAHLRANIACVLYFFMIREILKGTGSLAERLQAGLDKGFGYYDRDPENAEELKYYGRLRDLGTFARTPADAIRSSGYVVDSLEAAVWSLVTTASFEEALLKAVNLGRDTDTVGAIAGGLAGLYYGYEAIPAEWAAKLKRKEWIEELCEKAEQAVG